MVDSQDLNSPLDIQYGPDESVFLDAIEALRLKDSQNINDRAYQALTNSKAFHAQKLYKIKQLREKYKVLYHLRPKLNGFYVSVKQKFNRLLPLIYKETYNDDNIYEKFNIKFCLDGTRIGRNITILNLNFSVLNEKGKCKTARGHYLLGLFKIKSEDYETIYECVSNIFNEIDSINEISFEDKTFKIEKFLGGDWKILAILAGINSAHSHYSCIHCTCKKDEFYNTNIDWSISDINKGARSLEECLFRLHLNEKKTDDRKGYVNKPICDIPFFRLIIDLLHLKLRITEKLNDYLFEKIYELNEIDKYYVHSSNVDIRSRYVGRMYDFLEKDCKILDPISVKNNVYTLKNLRGAEITRFYEKLCEKNLEGNYMFDFSNLFPEIEKKEIIDLLYKDFYRIFISIKETTINPEQIKEQTREWLNRFITVYQRSQVTPYMHSFAQHIHELQALVQSINDFNQEGHEKFNDMCTLYYFRCNNKNRKNNKDLMQLFYKFNRKELIDLIFKFE